MRCLCIGDFTAESGSTVTWSAALAVTHDDLIEAEVYVLYWFSVKWRLELLAIVRSNRMELPGDNPSVVAGVTGSKRINALRLT